MRSIIVSVILGSFALEGALADGVLLKPTTAIAFIKALEQQAPTIKYDCRTYGGKKYRASQTSIAESAAASIS